MRPRVLLPAERLEPLPAATTAHRDLRIRVVGPQKVAAALPLDSAAAH